MDSSLRGVLFFMEDSLMPEQKKSDLFFDLDWATLEGWAGAKTLSRGMEYQRSGRVDSLARSRDGTLVAWVNGSERYATAVYFDDGLVSECTCPVGDSCKHAVAVILEYLALCEKKCPVPSLTAGDSRLTLLDIPVGPDHPEEGLTASPVRSVPARSPLPQTDHCRSQKPAHTLRQYLTRMKKEELIDLIHELANEFPDVEQEMSDRRAVADADAHPLVDALLADIDAITQEEAWSNTWTGRSEIPDYTPVRKRMEILLLMGHPDVVVDAGSILLKKGTEQIEQSNDDDGETSGEIALCMDIVFDALRSSSRPDHERILFAIHARRADEFDLCGGADKFLKETWPAAAWGLVADSLLCELGTCGITPGKDDFSEKYRRDGITRWIIIALDNAGREAEATDLCTAEAELTDSYRRLVRRLLPLGKTTEAAEWIRRGIGATQKTHPGIARELQEIRREVWEKEGDWLAVSGLRAEEFLSRPSYDAYCQLKSAAEKAGVWDTVEYPVMQYLASGCAPSVTREGTNGALLVFGQIPLSGLIEQGSWKLQKEPFFPVLIDRAIANRQPEDAVMWFDRLRAERAGSGEYYPEHRLWDVAADRFPERALSFWMACADREAQTAQPKGYENAIGYLKKIRALMERQGKTVEWGVYLAGVRTVHARKKKFTGMIDVIEGKKILKS